MARRSAAAGEVESSAKKRKTVRWKSQYESSRDLAGMLGVSVNRVNKAIRSGRLTPDVTKHRLYLFEKSKIKEHIAKWNEKPLVPPTSASEVVVITPFGMIRPRAEPDVQVLGPLLLIQPKRTSRRGYLTRPADYNLADLSSRPSRPASTHIFASTSLKSVQTKAGRKTRPTT